MFKSKVYEVSYIFSIELWIFKTLHSKADKQLSHECLKGAQKAAEYICSGENSEFTHCAQNLSIILTTGRKKSKSFFRLIYFRDRIMVPLSPLAMLGLGKLEVSQIQ